MQFNYVNKDGVVKMVEAPDLGTAASMALDADQHSGFQQVAGPTPPPPAPPAASTPSSPPVAEEDTPYKLYGDLIPSGAPDPLQKAYDRAGRQAAADANINVDENKIRSNVLRQFQAEIDATNQIYADKLREARIEGQGRLGSGYAIQARRGLLGSDFGGAQTEEIQKKNTEIISGIQAEQAAKIAEIMGLARTASAAEIAAKNKARQDGLQSYITFLKEGDTRKAQKAKDAAAAILARGTSPDKIGDDVLDKIAQGYGVTKQAIADAYAVAKKADAEAKAKEGFTLGEGQKRYDSAGNELAAGPEKTAPKTASIQEYEYAKENGYKGTFNDFRSENTYGRIGTDELGNPVYGFINKNTGTTTPSGGGSGNGNNINVFGIKATSTTAQYGGKDSGVPAKDGGTFLASQGYDKDKEIAGKLLTSDIYKNLSVDAALRKWSNNGYGADGIQGVDPRAKIGDLPPQQIEAVLAGIAKNEGIAPGGGGGGAPSKTAQGWIDAINNGTAKLDDVPTPLKSAVVGGIKVEGASSPLKKDALASAQGLLKKFDEGNKFAVGKSGVFPVFPGTKAADFKIHFKNLKSMLSLDNVKLLKGQGAVSDAERDLLAAASARLDLAQTEDEFRSALVDIVHSLDGSLSTANQGNTSQTPSGIKVEPLP